MLHPSPAPFYIQLVFQLQNVSKDLEKKAAWCQSSQCQATNQISKQHLVARPRGKYVLLEALQRAIELILVPRIGSRVCILPECRVSSNQSPSREHLYKFLGDRHDQVLTSSQQGASRCLTSSVRSRAGSWRRMRHCYLCTSSTSPWSCR